MGKNIKKNKQKTIVVLIVIITLLLIEYIYLNNGYAYGNENKLTGNIKNVNINQNAPYKIEQTFEAKYDNLQYIRIFFKINEKRENAYITDEENISKANLKIIDLEENNIIYEKNITYNQLQNSPIYKLKFNTQKHSAGKTYKIEIEYLADSSEKYDFEPTFQEKNENVTVNGEKIENTILNYADYYFDTSATIIVTIASIIVSVITIFIAFYIIEQEKLTEEKAFLLIFPIACIMMTFAMPIFNGHDEAVHWLRTYDISQGNLVSGNTIDVPKQVNDIATTYSRYSDISFEAMDGQQTEVAIPTGAVYNPIQYTSQVLGTIIGRIITNRPTIIAYIARIFNIIACTIILYYSIKIIPFGKKILLLFTFIPIAIEGFCTLSADGLTISICYLLIAYILNIAYNKKIEKISLKQKILLGILSSVVACCKLVYLPLILLIWIIPKEKFKSKKDKILSILTINIIPIIINIVWMIISMSVLASRSGESSEQILKALKNPINFFQMILYTINNNIDKYILTMFGQEMEWSENIMLKITSLIFWITTIAITIMDNTIKKKLLKKDKIIILLILTIIIGLIFCALYVQYTYAESSQIQGIQGRYFIPILPLIILLVGDLKIETKYTNTQLVKIIALLAITIQPYIIINIVMYHV